jgi:choline dehydrogenase-like flavoprotein
MYNLTSVPQPGLGGLPKPLAAGSVVGGSSAVNGMFFMRGSAEDYDAWVWAAGDRNEKFAAEWGWKNLLPFFKKSVTFVPPKKEVAEKYNITYDVKAAYGGTTPIYSSYRPFQWPNTSEYAKLLILELTLIMVASSCHVECIEKNPRSEISKGGRER